MNSSASLIETRLLPAARVARSASSDASLWNYLCDPIAHLIHVLDECHRPMFSFGGFGSGEGQLDTPTDVAVVWIDPVDSALAADFPVLAVADRGNHRVQLFELDGAPIGVLGDRNADAPRGHWAPRTGWPLFRLGSLPPIPFPSRLTWRSPYLDVVCLGAIVVRIDLAAALLPDFSVWIGDAPLSALRQAFRRFTADPNRAEIPDWCLFEIVERLQPPSCRGMAALPLGRG
jgi:hypothetical protein